MGKKLQITLDSIDLGQALDGLRLREEAWRNTAEYLRTGRSPNDFFLSEECSDWQEAERIARHYRSIIDEMERQVSDQGGW